MGEKKDKPHMNLVIIGHIDNGKSTLMGHVLVLSKAVSEREEREIEKIAKDLDRETFKFAFFMDRLAEERKRGITIDLAFRKFETEHKYFTIIDAPGHRDFVKNMITGASQADAAILVISAKTGEMETSTGENGQGREHAYLAKTLGIKSLIVAVNKMDDPSVGFQEKRFNDCKEEISKLLKLVGYNLEKDVQFIPVSAYNGDNLLERGPNLPWWKGPTLLQAIDQLPLPKKPLDKPLRIPIQDVYKIKGAGVIPVGRVETGEIRVGQKLIVQPSAFVQECKSIEMHHEAMEKAGPGDNIGFQIRNADMNVLKRGYMVGPAEKPPACVTETGWIEAHTIVIFHPSAINVGYTPVVHAHTAQISCRFKELVRKVDRQTGQTIDEAPTFLKQNEAGVVRLQPLKKFCVEKYKDFPEIGRIAVRDMGRTVAVGVVLNIQEK